MPRIVPSQVVEVIDQLFPDPNIPIQVIGTGGVHLAAIVALAKEIPPELLTLTGQDLSDCLVSLQYVENTLQLALKDPTYGYQVPKYRGMNTIALLRQSLAKCLDEAPAPGTAELLFIEDLSLRDSIRRDVSAANLDMVNGEWKGATVLAGSATEALLLWAVQEEERQQNGVIASAVAALIGAATLTQKPSANPERWTFIELIEVALHTGLIKAETAKQARLGKDF